MSNLTKKGNLSLLSSLEKKNVEHLSIKRLSVGKILEEPIDFLYKKGKKIHHSH